jgi:hypothetical protein
MGRGDSGLQLLDDSTLQAAEASAAKQASPEVPFPRSLAAPQWRKVAAEWHPELNGDLRPCDVYAGENKKRWWLCPGKRAPDGELLQHKYEAGTSQRTSYQTGCPYCANRKPCPRTNTLSALFPEIAAQLHPTLNGDITADDVIAGGGRKLWWLCPGKRAPNGELVQHKYEAGTGTRTRKTNPTSCPYCTGRKLCPRTNTLSTLFPEIAAELHPTLNGDITADDVIAGEAGKRWWLCPGKIALNGELVQHEYEAQTSARTRQTSPTGCPECAALTNLRRYLLRLQEVLASANHQELWQFDGEEARRQWLKRCGAEYVGGSSKVIVEALALGFIDKKQLDEFLGSECPEQLVEQLLATPELISAVEKKPIPERERKPILARDGNCCLCGATKKLEVDHFVPEALGGTIEDNLWTLCRSCNRRKHSKLPTTRMIEAWVARGLPKPACWDEVWESAGETPPPFAIADTALLAA